MMNDYESLEQLSKRFQDKIIANQKSLNEIRTNQFSNMTGDNQLVNFEEIRKKHQEFNYNEKSQLSILVEEMSALLKEKIKEVFEEEKLFKNKERMQKKILLEELEKEQSKQLAHALQLSADELNTPLMPLIIHVDMLLNKQELTEQQKNHLRIVRQNILSGLSAY